MSDAPLCYAYDPATGLSIGTLAADPSPLEPGVWLYPGSTCLDPPPVPGTKQAVVRRGSVWVLVPDRRGETWWEASGRAVVVTAVGDPATVGLTATAPAVPAPLPTVTGNQWAFALSSLGLSAAWQVGVTKSKASDQVRAGLIARDTPLLAADPLLARVAANAGADANGNLLIVVATVFAAAQGMPQ